MDILTAMGEMRATALRNGRTPRRWEVNQAALDALQASEEMSRIDARETRIIDRPVFGIRMMLVHDTSPDPRAWLIVDETNP